MIDIAVLEAMVAEGATAATIVRVVKMMVAREDAQRAQWRERKARSRSKPQVVTTTERLSGHVTVTGQSRDIPYKEERFPPAPPSKEEITPLDIGRAKRATAYQEDFTFNEADYAAMREVGWGDAKAAAELSKFKDHALAKGRLAKDWHAAWRNWVRSPFQVANPQHNGGHNGHATSLAPSAIRRTEDAVAETLARRQERFRFG